jgi:hypothetical protein
VRRGAEFCPENEGAVFAKKIFGHLICDGGSTIYAIFVVDLSFYPGYHGNHWRTTFLYEYSILSFLFLGIFFYS